MALNKLIPSLLILAFGMGLMLSSSTWAAKGKAVEDVQITKLVAQAKTKADHEKIAGMLEKEAKSEEAKAKSLRDQAEAYKEHKHEVYGKDIADLEEHTEALARNYEESAKRHKSLADIHHRIASELK
jgi:uncharacterized membrane protein YqiK